MSIFDKANDAPLPGGGRHFTDGRYLCRLEAFKRGVSQQGKGDFVVAEVTILDTLLAYETSNKPGERISWIQLARWQPFASNCKQFIVAATGYKLDGSDLVGPGDKRIKVSDALTRASDGDGTMLSGALMVADVTTVKTKTGSDFSKVIWTTAPPDVIAAYKAKAA